MFFPDCLPHLKREARSSTESAERAVLMFERGERVKTSRRVRSETAGASRIPRWHFLLRFAVMIFSKPTQHGHMLFSSHSQSLFGLIRVGVCQVK